MLGDFAAPADPNPVVAQDVIDETGKRGGARRLASETAMHSDGHHLGRQTGSALFPRPQWPLLSSTRQVSVSARRCATPCPIPALTISCQVRRDKAVHAICQAVSRVWASGGLGATAFGIRSAGRLPGQLHRRITIPISARIVWALGKGWRANSRRSDRATMPYSRRDR